MRTAISLPEELFRDADELAERLKTSRSDVYQRALEEFVVRHDVDQVRDSIDRVIAEIGGEPDEFVRAAAQRVLEETEW